MKKDLFVIEAPGKVKSLFKILSKFRKKGSFDVIATQGRLLDLPDNSLGMDLDTLELTQWNPVRDHSYEFVKEKVEKAKEIYICTDNDIEGELIGYQVRQLIPDETPFHRMRIQSLTPESIQKSISELDHIDMNKVRSGVARRLTDRLIGFGLSRHDWKNTELQNTPRGSVGRILTPVLSSLYEQPIIPSQLEIQVKESGSHWSLSAAIPPSLNEDRDDIAYALSQFNKPEIEWVETKEENIEFAPWNGGEVLLNVSESLNMSIEDTAALLQELYEEGRLSYPRSDSKTISEDNIKALSHMAVELGVDQFSEARLRVSIEVQKSLQGVETYVQGAHEAPLPTEMDKLPMYKDPKDLDIKEQALVLIAKQALKAGYDEPKKVTRLGRLANSDRNTDWQNTAHRYGLTFIAREDVITFGRYKKEHKINHMTHPNGIARKVADKQGQVRVYKTPLDHAVLDRMITLNLGRPSTYPHHVNKVASKYLTKNGELNKRAMQTIRLADLVAPDLLSPANAANLELILYAQDGASIFDKIEKALESINIDIEYIKDKMPERHLMSDQSKVFNEKRTPSTKTKTRQQPRKDYNNGYEI